MVVFLLDERVGTSMWPEVLLSLKRAKTSGHCSASGWATGFLPQHFAGWSSSYLKEDFVFICSHTFKKNWPSFEYLRNAQTNQN
jgi:hypothetical protein